MIQLACVDAVHAHSGWAVIVTEPVPPFPATSLGDAAAVTAHFAGEGLVVSAADPPHVADAAHRPAKSTGSARLDHAEVGAGGNSTHESTGSPSAREQNGDQRTRPVSIVPGSEVWSTLPTFGSDPSWAEGRRPVRYP